MNSQNLNLGSEPQREIQTQQRDWSSYRGVAAGVLRDSQKRRRHAMYLRRLMSSWGYRNEDAAWKNDSTSAPIRFHITSANADQDFFAWAVSFWWLKSAPFKRTAPFFGGRVVGTTTGRAKLPVCSYNSRSAVVGTGATAGSYQARQGCS